MATLPAYDSVMCVLGAPPPPNWETPRRGPFLRGEGGQNAGGKQGVGAKPPSPPSRVCASPGKWLALAQVAS